MAQDHFITSAWEPGEIDWHFLILFKDQLQINRMIKSYQQIIAYPGLYSPIPIEYLHLTVLRVNSVTNVTRNEMMLISERLIPILSSIELPNFILGPWWLLDGSVVLHITPEEPINKIFDEVLKVTTSILGDRAPKPSLFIPHVTLTYAKTYEDEYDLRKILSAQQIQPVEFKIDDLYLVEERQTKPDYSFDIVRKIPVGL